LASKQSDFNSIIKSRSLTEKQLNKAGNRKDQLAKEQVELLHQILSKILEVHNSLMTLHGSPILPTEQTLISKLSKPLSKDKADFAREV
jgi:CBS domain containing-hemolysin-like protein